MVEIFIIDPPWPASRMCLPMYFDNRHAPSKFVLKTSSHSSSEISSEESVPPNKHNFKGHYGIDREGQDQLRNEVDAGQENGL